MVTIKLLTSLLLAVVVILSVFSYHQHQENKYLMSIMTIDHAMTNNVILTDKEMEKLSKYGESHKNVKNLLLVYETKRDHLTGADNGTPEAPANVMKVTYEKYKNIAFKGAK